VTHSTLQMGLALSGILVGLGLTIILTGFGRAWASREKKTDEVSFNIPDTMPEQISEPALTS